VASKEGLDLEDELDEVKNEDDDDDDAADCELYDGAEDPCRHGVGIFPADPPDVELRSAVDETVAVRHADDEQQSHGHSFCLNQPSVTRMATAVLRTRSLSDEADKRNR